MDIDYSVNSELKKLQFFGAGPKAAVPQAGEVKGEVRLSSKVMLSISQKSRSVIL